MAQVGDNISKHLFPAHFALSLLPSYDLRLPSPAVMEAYICFTQSLPLSTELDLPRSFILETELRRDSVRDVTCSEVAAPMRNIVVSYQSLHLVCIALGLHCYPFHVLVPMANGLK